MGHLLLGDLPRTRRWQEVVGLLESDSSHFQIAAATLEASGTVADNAASDPAVVHTLLLLAQIPLLAREGNLSEGLQGLGVSVPDEPGLFDLVSGVAEGMRVHGIQYGIRTDLGEMAQSALAETLTSAAGSGTKDLFETTPADLRRTLGSFATTKRFGILARDFFARFTQKYLSYYLSRELSNHVGPRRRFANIGEHAAFDDALALHCRQASRIVEDFAGGWFSKAVFEKTITHARVRGFLHVALEKISSELAREGSK